MIVRSTWQKAVYRLLCRYRTRHFIESDGSPNSASSKRVKASRAIDCSTAGAAEVAKDNEGKQKLDAPGLADQYVMVDPSDAQEEPPILPPVCVTAFDDDGATWIFSQVAERLDQKASSVPPMHCVGHESPLDQLSLKTLQVSDAKKPVEEIIAHRRTDSKTAKENRRRRRSSKAQGKAVSSVKGEIQVSPNKRNMRGPIISVADMPI